MKNFLKSSTLLLATLALFQSCSSDEFEEEMISDEQQISSDLTQKIITTATYVNDYNFFVDNVNNSNCDFPSTACYFNNPQGDYYQFNIIVDSFDLWLSEYNLAKLEAFNVTGVAFTDEDFILSQMEILSGFGGLTTREDFLQYFESCSDFGSTQEYSVPLIEVNSACNGNEAEIFLALAGESTTITDINDITSIENFLNTVNNNSNENYSVDDILISAVVYETSYGEEVALFEREDILNYFDDCLFNRDDTISNCLVFEYPIEVNRFSIELEEVITYAIENDIELVDTFEEEIGELVFVYPINLIGQDGSINEVSSNEILENLLENSTNYCN